MLVRRSVWCEAWSRTGWHHRFLTGWSKHRLGLSQSQYIVRPIGNFHQIGATDSSFAAHSYGRQYEGKSPFKKWTGPKTIWWNVWHLNISKPSVIQFFVHVTNCFYFHFIKILSLCKLICAQYWRLISGYRNWPRYGLRWSGLCCHSRHSTSGPAVARPLAAAPAGPRVLCREWQHKPRQRRPYEWSISILPRKRSNTQR